MFQQRKIQIIFARRSLTLIDTRYRLVIQEEELHHNATAGVVLSDHSLVLQSITRESAGGYTCMAANVEGRTKSNVVNLAVMCKYVLRALARRQEHASPRESAVA